MPEAGGSRANPATRCTTGGDPELGAGRIAGGKPTPDKLGGGLFQLVIRSAGGRQPAGGASGHQGGALACRPLDPAG